MPPHEGEVDRSAGSTVALDAVRKLLDYLKDVPETGQQLLQTVVQ